MKHSYVLAALAIVFASVMLTSCKGKSSNKGSDAEQTLEENGPQYDIETSLGTIRIQLYVKTPKHRANFEKLAKSGFYDGILFHRVINGFMIQTGDPLTKQEGMEDRYGTGGPGYNVPAEFVPEYKHIKGALAAARKGDLANPLKESSGSQFYIVQNADNCVHLNGQYTVFGETVDGFDVIDAIAYMPTDIRDCPLEPIKIISVKPVVSEEELAEAESEEKAEDEVSAE